MYIDERGREILVGQEALDNFAKGISRLMENRKLHYRTTFQDLPISVENRKGSIRSGIDPDGDEWKTKMKIPYGYIPGTKGADGDAVDCFVGPCENAAYAYVVHSNNPETGEFDEDKVMLGFESADDAKRVFMQHYDDPKFFGGMDSVPMWKFRDIVWVKKHTTDKIKESRRFTEGKKGGSDFIKIPITILLKIVSKKLKKGSKESSSNGKRERAEGAFIPAGLFASASLTRESRGGQAHIFTGMKRSMLGHHQDIMEDPQVREHGTKGMHWGTRSPQEVIEQAGGKYIGAMDNPKGGKIHGFKDPKTGSTMWLKDEQIRDPQSVRDHMDASRKQFKSSEAQEHGVSGMKWGVRHVRKDAAGERHPTTGKQQHAMRRSLANDPKTLNMMQHVTKGQSALAHYNAQRAQQKQTGRPPDPKQSHNEATNALKELGWRVAQAVANVSGLGGAFAAVSSIVRSPSGQKMFLHTDQNGQSRLTNDKKGKIPAGGQRRTRTSVRESVSFDERLGRFLREAKKPKIYYARSLQHYKTSKESDDIDFLKEAFPGASIKFPKTRRHAELGMGHFHKQIDKAKEVVIRPLRKRRVTAGVFSEAQHALHAGKKVHMLFEGRLRRVKRLEMIEGGNPAGEYARVILKKEKKSKS